MMRCICCTEELPRSVVQENCTNSVPGRLQYNFNRVAIDVTISHHCLLFKVEKVLQQVVLVLQKFLSQNLLTLQFTLIHRSLHYYFVVYTLGYIHTLQFGVLHLSCMSYPVVYTCVYCVTLQFTPQLIVLPCSLHLNLQSYPVVYTLLYDYTLQFTPQFTVLPCS